MKKILFSDAYGLTNAVLSRKKTMTRRIVGNGNDILLNYELFQRLKANHETGVNYLEDYLIRSYSKFQIGETVAIAQRYRDLFADGSYQGKFNNKFKQRKAGWKNKLFVSADDMPHHIVIKAIRIELLQNISDEDIIREGIEKTVLFLNGKEKVRWIYKIVNNIVGFASARSAFESLFTNINGKGVWDLNPLVFVYEFELID